MSLACFGVLAACNLSLTLLSFDHLEIVLLVDRLVLLQELLTVIGKLFCSETSHLLAQVLLRLVSKEISMCIGRGACEQMIILLFIIIAVDRAHLLDSAILHLHSDRPLYHPGVFLALWLLVIVLSSTSMAMAAIRSNTALVHGVFGAQILTFHID